MDIKSHRDKLCYSDCGKTYGIYRNLCNDREKSLINKIHTDRIILITKDTNQMHSITLYISSILGHKHYIAIIIKFKEINRNH